MKTKTIISFLTGLLFINTLSAQQTTIKGQILDADDKSPVSFANIVLLTQDSAYISGASSNADGYFEIKNTPEEKCLLIVSYIGHETAHVPVIPGETNEDIRLLLKESAISLNEVTIKARSVMVKDDRKVILPTEEQIRTSSDGTDVIRKMQLPRIMVDPISGEISMSGKGEVQLRINGVQVSNTEIASVPPADILRIEFHDDPGARYGNTDIVIDYITRHKESGGNINGVLSNSIGGNRTSADDRISLKYNYGKSALTTNVLFIQRKQNWTREYDETLVFPDHELHRLEAGEPTLFNKKVLNSNLNYSLTEKNRYFLNAQLRYTLNDFPNSFEDRRSKLYTSGSETPLSIYDHTKEKNHSPALDLYFQYNPGNNRLLVFNVVGTYINTQSKRIYQEKREETFETDLLSDIRGDKYSLIIEGIYEKTTGTNKITAGMKHLQSHTNNQYDGTTTAEVSMRQAESSVYAEYQGRTGKIGYMANITGVRLYYSQCSSHTEKYALQPAARLTFEPNKDIYFRYRINLRNNTPSPAAMNQVEQAIDAWQIRRGNPGLKAFSILDQNVTAGFNKGIWGIDVLVGYNHEYKPVMESVYYEDGRFIRTYENQISFQNLSAEATFRLKPWKNHLSLSITPRIDRFISRGNDYLHTYTMPEWRVNLDFSYNNWLANFTTITPRRFMYGEQLSKSDQMYTITAGYKKSGWSVMVGVLNPFTSEYKTDNRSWSSINPVKSKIHTNHNKSVLVKLNFNLNYGKQSGNNYKCLNNNDTDSGIMQGTKNL